MAAPNVTITASNGTQVGFGLLDDSKLTRGGAGANQGGWQVVDRPRQSATTAWLDYSPFALTMKLMVECVNPAAPASVEQQCATVEGWELPVGNPPEPPTVTVTGPVPHQNLAWVVQQLTWGAALRLSTGERFQQELDVTLLEYRPPAGVSQGSNTGAAAKTNTAAGGPASARTYTVRAGDTLESVAAAQLGSWARWSDIAALNGIVDPASLQTGQTINLPAS